jgi:LDH2 family malate/lactate/ureidoglycolate dehydrogenase
MAVFGTKTPLIGTNPLAVAIPAGDHLPIVLDMSTSVVARGKIRYAALMGQSIPLGWARDPEGKPTQDAGLALKGSLEPVGGPKGSGLSLIIDLLCGVLTNTVLTGGVKTVTDMTGPAVTGHFFSALDISKFIDIKLFKTNVDQVITNIKNFPPVIDGGKIFMPGEIELLAEKKRIEEGIPLDQEVVDLLNQVAARYGVAPLLSSI